MKGRYALVIRLAPGERLTVGRLGAYDFPAGYYLYLGSARNGLAGRVGRHLLRDKKLHWHIDYLTATAGVCKVWWSGDGEGTERRECEWAQAALKCGATVKAPGFGASDCRCPTHLLYLESRSGVRQLRQALMDGLPATTPKGWFDAGDAVAFDQLRESR